MMDRLIDYVASVNGIRIILKFIPDHIKSGDYHFAIGTAGSTSLVFQTILPALIKADGISKITFEGGTHNPYAPPFDFLKNVFLKVLKNMNINVELNLSQYGFYPAGGGKFEAVIHPVNKIQPLSLLDREAVTHVAARGIVANIPETISEKEIKIIQKRFSLPDDKVTVETVNSVGPGNIVSITIDSDNMTEMFFGFGEKRVRASRVADRCAKEAENYLQSAAPVGEHLADQLLIPMAMAGDCQFHCVAPTKHTLTNVEIIKTFLENNIHLEKISSHVWKFIIE